MSRSSRYRDKVEVQYAFQGWKISLWEHRFLLENEAVGNRTCSWCARNVLSHSNFAVINADDFMGVKPFLPYFIPSMIFLSATDNNSMRGAIVGFRLNETLSDHGR